MENEKFLNAFSRLSFVTACFFLTMAILEKGLNIFGLSIPVIDLFPRQLLNWTVPPLLFFVAIVLMQIRDEWKARGKTSSESGSSLHEGRKPPTRKRFQGPAPVVILPVGRERKGNG